MATPRSDLLWTVFCQLLVVGAVFVQYWLVRTYWGVPAFGEYSLVVRVRGAIEWIILLQLPLAMARVVSSTQNPRPRAVTATVGLALGTGLLLAACGIFLVVPQAISSLLFGNIGFVPWVGPLCALLAGYCLVLLVTGWLRGLFRFGAANAVNVLAIAVVPTLVIAGSGSLEPGAAVTAAGLASALVTLAAMLWLATRSKHQTSPGLAWPEPGEGLASAWQLLSYGVPRLATLAASALFALCLPWLVAREGQLTLLASLNALLALLGGAAVLTSPIGFVLLPRFSRDIGAGNRDAAAAQLASLVSATLVAGVLGSCAALGLGDLALGILLGKPDTGATALVVATAAAVPLFLLADVLRGPIDAVSHRPFNGLMYVAGFLAATGTYALADLPGTWRCATALLAGYVATAITGIWLASTLYGRALLSGRDAIPVLAWIVLMVVATAAATLESGPGRPVIAMGGALVLGGYLWLQPPDWLRLLRPGPAP